MTGNGWKCLEWLKMAEKIYGNGWNCRQWLEMNGNGLNGWQISENGYKWLEIA